jgi:hypothetical protein
MSEPNLENSSRYRSLINEINSSLWYGHLNESDVRRAVEEAILRHEQRKQKYGLKVGKVEASRGHSIT